MSRSNRLFDLIQILRDGRLHRAADLALDLGVSVRSIWRDMAMLAASGMPVEGERGVGYMLRQPITLPPMMLQPAELIALRLGVRLVAEGADANLAAAARSLAGKIATVAPAPRDAGVGEDLFAPAAAAPQRASPHLPLLRKAIRQSERLTIAVLDAAGQLTQREIRPCFLWARPIAGYRAARRKLSTRSRQAADRLPQMASLGPWAGLGIGCLSKPEMGK